LARMGGWGRRAGCRLDREENKRLCLPGQGRRGDSRRMKNGRPSLRPFSSAISGSIGPDDHAVAVVRPLGQKDPRGEPASLSCRASCPAQSGFWEVLTCRNIPSESASIRVESAAGRILGHRGGLRRGRGGLESFPRKPGRGQPEVLATAREGGDGSRGRLAKVEGGDVIAQPTHQGGCSATSGRSGPRSRGPAPPGDWWPDRRSTPSPRTGASRSIHRRTRPLGSAPRRSGELDPAHFRQAEAVVDLEHVLVAGHIQPVARGAEGHLPGALVGMERGHGRFAPVVSYSTTAVSARHRTRSPQKVAPTSPAGRTVVDRLLGVVRDELGRRPPVTASNISLTAPKSARGTSGRDRETRAGFDAEPA
jgi:hypothetical protein